MGFVVVAVKDQMYYCSFFHISCWNISDWHVLDFSSKNQTLFYRWRRNNTSLPATSMVIAPSLLVSTTVPDAYKQPQILRFFSAVQKDTARNSFWNMVLLNDKERTMNKKMAPIAISRAGPAVWIGVRANP